MKKIWARIKDKTASIGIASPVIGSPPVYIPIGQEADKDKIISAAIGFAKTLPVPFLVYFLDEDKKTIAVYNPRSEQFALRRRAERRWRRCAKGC
ncbi:MAG: hypothetical protein RQ862_03540 [Candidatus Caldarchaeales archaeon]|jgi:hypothetical protein|nr:hypothetical protein [Candidatus Caldarchaeales archaeon]